MAKKRSLGYDTGAPLLAVYLHGRRVGTLGVSGSDIWFKYDEWVVDDPQPGRWRLSLKLPVTPATYGREPTLVFFDNLLLESDTRRELASAAKRDVSDAAGLLGRVGGECAGAVALWPMDTRPTQPPYQYRALAADELNQAFSTPHGSRLSQLQLESKQSMSGVQHKLVLRRRGDAYDLPLAGAPSTVIIKRSTGRYEGLAANEYFCLRLFAAAGLGAAKATVVGGPDGFLEVHRYDRDEDVATGTIRRIHQEDFCQATGRRVTEKYQRYGGPGFGDVAEVLRRQSISAAVDIQRLIGAALLNVCLGNMDAHAKNFALLYQGDDVRLAPFYDIVCTEAYQGLDVELSMKLGHTDAPRLSPADLDRFARDLKVGRSLVNQEMAHLVTILPSILDLELDAAIRAVGDAPILHRINQIARSRIDMFQALCAR